MNKINELNYTVLGLIEDLNDLKSSKDHKNREVLKKYSIQSVKDIDELIKEKDSELERICSEIEKKKTVSKRNYDITKKTYHDINTEKVKGTYKGAVDASKNADKSYEEVLKLIYAYKGKQSQTSAPISSSGTLNSYIVSPGATNHYPLNTVKRVDYKSDNLEEKICGKYLNAHPPCFTNNPKISLSTTVPEKYKTNFCLTHYIKK